MSVTLKDFARDPGLLLIPVVPTQPENDWEDFPEKYLPCFISARPKINEDFNLSN